jgi:hypothetical protein
MKWLERSVLLMLLAGLLMAPQTAQINSYVNGQILTADQLNAEFGNLYSTINGLDEDNLLSTTSIPPAYITATINGQGLDRSIAGVLSVNGIISDGSAGTPGLRFNSDTNTGLYRIGADNVGFSLGGTLRWDIDTTDIVSTLPLRGPSGSASSPTFSFSGDSNTGVYLSGTDQVGLSAGGTVRLSVDPTDVTSTLPYIGPVGSASAPTYSFSGDDNTGMYSSSSGVVAFASNGAPKMTVDPNSLDLATGVGLSIDESEACANGNVCSSTYTPTLSSIAGLDATPVGDVFQWSRVGDIVTMSGEIDTVRNDGVDSTSSFRISLPSVSGNFSSTTEVSGICIADIAGGSGSGNNASYWVRAVTGAQTALVSTDSKRQLQHLPLTALHDHL